MPVRKTTKTVENNVVGANLAIWIIIFIAIVAVCMAAFFFETDNNVTPRTFTDNDNVRVIQPNTNYNK